MVYNVLIIVAALMSDTLPARWFSPSSAAASLTLQQLLNTENGTFKSRAEPS